MHKKKFRIYLSLVILTCTISFAAQENPGQDVCDDQKISALHKDIYFQLQSPGCKNFIPKTSITNLYRCAQDHSMHDCQELQNLITLLDTTIDGLRKEITNTQQKLSELNNPIYNSDNSLFLKKFGEKEILKREETIKSIEEMKNNIKKLIELVNYTQK